MYARTEKKERSLGIKLFLKPQRCNSPKCATMRHPNRPGQHGGARRRAMSEFGQQLQEKQKFKFTYGLREAQMRRVVEKAIKNPSNTGPLIVSLLERRLDNTVYRLGFAPSRSVARQVVGHGHIMVNGRKVTVPSFQVKVGDVISIRPQSKDYNLFKNLPTEIAKYEAPIWLSLDKDKLTGKVVSLPKDFEIPFDVNMVIDYYSK